MSDDFDRRVQERIDKATGPWQTRRIGPIETRYRRRPRREFVELNVALDDLGRELLAFPPGSWIVRFVWWVNGKLGGPSKPSGGLQVDQPPPDEPPEP